MPTFEFNYENTPDPQGHMAAYGLRVGCRVGLHSITEEHLKSQGGKLPDPVVGNALIDTGASLSAIDQIAASALSLPVIAQAKVGTADGPRTSSVHPFTIHLAGLRINVVRGIAANLKGQGIIALIGMDFLAKCTFIMVGPEGKFVIITPDLPGPTQQETPPIA